MIRFQFITPAMASQRNAPGFVCRTAPLAEIDGRIAPIAESGGGHAP